MITWHREPAVVINGGGLTMIIVPGRGGKIVSLTDDTGTEWPRGVDPRGDVSQFLLNSRRKCPLDV